MAEIQTEEHILIAVRGSLNEEIRVETIKLSEEDEDFYEGDDFGEYVDEILEDAMTLPIDKVAIKMLIEMFDSKN